MALCHANAHANVNKGRSEFDQMPRVLYLKLEEYRTEVRLGAHIGDVTDTQHMWGHKQYVMTSIDVPKGLVKRLV